MYSKLSNTSIPPIDDILTDTIKSAEPGIGGNEALLNIPQNSGTGASESDCLASYPGHFREVSNPLA